MSKITKLWEEESKRLEGDPLNWDQVRAWLDNSGYLKSSKLTYLGKGAEWAYANSSMCVLWSEDSHALIESSRQHLCVFSIHNFKIVWSELFENTLERAAVREYVDTIRENIFNLRSLRLEGTEFSVLDRNLNSTLDRIERQVMDIDKCLNHCLIGGIK